MRNKFNQFREMAKVFWENISLEAKETKEAAQIIRKYASEGSISDEEEKALKLQVYDILKMAGIGIPFALIPGASVLIPLLVKYAKKKNVDLLPSSFNKNKNNENTDNK